MATIGSPHASASSNTTGRFSNSLESTNTSAARMRSATASGGSAPRNRTFSPARASNSPRSSPSPTISKIGVQSRDGVDQVGMALLLGQRGHVEQPQSDLRRRGPGWKIDVSTTFGTTR